ncbi:MAG: hypothetical protein WAM98_11015 [Terriglobales bacterium]
MAIDEEKPDFALDIAKDAGRTLQTTFATAAAAGAVASAEATHNIPFGVGAALLTLVGEFAGRRINSRLNDVVEHFTNRLRKLGEEKIDREWFTSEEFQTLLFDALRQLQVTHDSAKLKMLGVGLANSGADGFKEEERKDLFIRFVRELTSQHVGVLLKLLPETFPLSKTVVRSERPTSTEEWEHRLAWSRRPTLTASNDDDLFAVQMLHAYGLVEEEIKSSIKEPHFSNISSAGQAREALRQFIKNVENAEVERSFRLSALGHDFVNFTGLREPTTPPAESSE